MGKAILLYRFYNNQIWKRWIEIRISGGGGNKYLTAGNWGPVTDVFKISISKIVLWIAANTGASIEVFVF